MYAVPLVVAGCFALRRLWPAALVLVVVGTAELCHNVWLQTPPGYLVHPREFRQFYDFKAQEAIRQRRPVPSMDEALQYYEKAHAPQRQIYLQAREHSSSLEWLLTLGCLLAYAWAFVAPFLGWGADPPNGKPPPMGKTISAGKRK